jgi:hypothetical protein
MKIKKLKHGMERLILLGLITDTTFLEKIQPILDIKAMSSIASKTICRWVLDYYEVYNKAPDRDIQLIWDQQSTTLREEEFDLTEELLEQITDELERRGSDFSCDFVLQQAVLFFQKQKMEADVEELQDLLDDGKIEEARDLLLNADLPQLEDRQIESTNILTDIDTLRTGFEDAAEPLIYFPNALGKFINRLLVRKGFVKVLAPQKRGKTWFLNEIALQALKQKRNVAYFNCGDLDNEEQSVRFAVRLARRSNLQENCGEFYSPVLDCKWNQDDSCTRGARKSGCGTGGIELTEPNDVELAPPSYTSCRVCCGEKQFKGTVWYKKVLVEEPLDWREALSINKKFIKRYRISEENFRMRSYATNTLTMPEIRKTLEGWAVDDGFTPDVIVIDYMDIVATDPKLRGTRDGEDYKWQDARGIAQDFNSLVVSASQAGKAFDVETLTEENFSEDRRKYSHVTGVLALNQTKDEAEMGIMRIGRFMCRNVQATRSQVVVLQNLRRGLIHLGSFFK